MFKFLASFLLVTSLAAQGPSGIVFDYYGQSSSAEWPFEPCYNGGFQTRLSVLNYLPRGDDHIEDSSDNDAFDYYVAIQKLDYPSFTPPGSNITIPDGPLNCGDIPVNYFVVSGLKEEHIQITYQMNGGYPVMLYNDAIHVMTTFTSYSGRNEADGWQEIAQFCVPNDPSLIGLTIYHQGFIVYGDSSIMSTQGAQVTLN